MGTVPRIFTICMYRGVTLDLREILHPSTDEKVKGMIKSVSLFLCNKECVALYSNRFIRDIV